MFSANTSQVSQDAIFVEDVFSTYLYTGNGSSQTITNGIDLAGKGGLVWGKVRNSGSGNENHYLFDTARGVEQALFSNLTAAQSDADSGVTAFNSNGFAVTAGRLNDNTYNYASWTFRKQAKFFDVVTWTGDGTTNRVLSHSLGSKPGFVLLKDCTSASNWDAYARDTDTAYYKGTLNSTNAMSGPSATYANQFTSTTFQVTTSGTNAFNVNGSQNVAYLFAHNAGGFGLTGADNVISCGSFTMDASGNPASVTLGYEPQMLIVKRTDSTSNWYIEDNMRGLPVTGNGAQLYANTSGAEAAQNIAYPSATGFTWNIGIPSATYIYIAIRRGPMKTPTSGTSVFAPVAYSGSGSTRTLDASIVPDLYIGNTRTPAGGPVGLFVDRLRGDSKYIRSYDTSAEQGTPPARDFSGQTGFRLDTTADNVSGRTYVSWFLRRAPGFFDEVCWTGNGASTRSVNHNLTVAPELLIAQNRTSGGNWYVYLPSGNRRVLLNSTGASPQYGGAFAGTTPTATTFSFDSDLNTSSQNYVAWLWASCPGVSKVGSYSGTGTTQQINCGFTAGARFVMIKRTDSTGDWYVWDSARGIVAGSDPYLTLNTTAAEVTTTDWVDTYSAGFELSNSAGNNVNINGATYIFLSVA